RTGAETERPLASRRSSTASSASRRRSSFGPAFDVRPVALIDLDESPDAAVIELSGADRPGLLAELARVLADNGLSIRSAHIAGFGERAVDSFYVTDAKGGRPKAGPKLERLREALEAVLDRRDANGRSVSAPVRASLRDVSEFGRKRPVSPRPEAR
ncbi:MAG: ACT domain-containing protein, partial [Brevundimonas sp.]